MGSTLTKVSSFLLQDFLRQFSRYNFGGHCLGLLFTNRLFNDLVLGNSFESLERDERLSPVQVWPGEATRQQEEWGAPVRRGPGRAGGFGNHAF